MSEAFKRYMVFSWSDYDNGHPFDGVEDFDSFDDAEAEYGLKLDAGWQNVMVFDRVDGLVRLEMSQDTEIRHD